MTIRATMLADSISLQNKRLRTWECIYPRFIHAEMMTHRMFSRNAASSRAIPVDRMIQMVRDDPARPIHWGRNQRGMQAREELLPEAAYKAQHEWDVATMLAVASAQNLASTGLHKQIVNRVLEPFMHMKAVFSATEMENFYALRRHPDAQPEIQELANQMWEAEQSSIPKILHPGEWHLPYINMQDWSDVSDWITDLSTDEFEALPRYPGEGEILPIVRKISCAMLARTSYDNHDGSKREILKDIELHDMLMVQTPLHASPAEHIATPDTKSYQEGAVLDWDEPHQHGNFRGWRQYRKMLPNENVPG